MYLNYGGIHKYNNLYTLVVKITNRSSSNAVFDLFGNNVRTYYMSSKQTGNEIILTMIYSPLSSLTQTAGLSFKIPSGETGTLDFTIAEAVLYNGCYCEAPVVNSSPMKYTIPNYPYNPVPTYLSRNYHNLFTRRNDISGNLNTFLPFFKIGVNTDAGAPTDYPIIIRFYGRCMYPDQSAKNSAVFEGFFGIHYIKNNGSPIFKVTPLHYSKSQIDLPPSTDASTNLTDIDLLQDSETVSVYMRFKFGEKSSYAQHVVLFYETNAPDWVYLESV